MTLPLPCSECDGTGDMLVEIPRPVHSAYDGAPPVQTKTVECDRCKGEGIVLCFCGAPATILVEGDPSCDECEVVNAPTREDVQMRGAA